MEPALKLPTFSSKNRNPPDFLKQFNKYYEHYSKKRNQNECLTYIEMIEQCFEQNTATWFQIIKHDIKDEDDFKIKFLNQFWSKQIQQSIKRRIEFEKYKEEGKLTRTEYFIDRTLTLKSMLPPLDDKEIIQMLADNFSERIQDAVRVQNISTLEHFIEILNREDQDKRTEKTKRNLNDNRGNRNVSQNNQSHRPTNNNNPSTQNYHQYDRYNKFMPTRNTPNQNSNYHSSNHNPNYNRNTNYYTRENNTTSWNRTNDYQNRNQNPPSNYNHQYPRDPPYRQNHNIQSPRRQQQRDVNEIQLTSNRGRIFIPTTEQMNCRDSLRIQSQYPKTTEDDRTESRSNERSAGRVNDPARIDNRPMSLN